MTDDDLSPPDAMSPAVLGFVITAGLIVAVVAAIGSYVHMYRLMTMTGEDGLLAFIYPASADGLVAAASALLYVQHRAGQERSAMAVIGAALGIGASLGANIASTIPEVAADEATHVLVAAWPPVALGIVGHLALQLLALRGRARPHEDARPRAVALTVNNNVAAVASLDAHSASMSGARAQPAPPAVDAAASPARDRVPPARALPVAASARALPPEDAGDALPADLIDIARVALASAGGNLSKRALNEAVKHKRGAGLSRARLDALHAHVTTIRDPRPVDNQDMEDSP